MIRVPRPGFSHIAQLIKALQRILKNKQLTKKTKIEFVTGFIRIGIEFLKYSLRLKVSNPIKIFGYNVYYSQQCTSAAIYLLKAIFLEWEYLVLLKTKEPLIIDAGANIGTATLFFKKIYPRSQIYAFEPDSDTFKFLEKNVRENSLLGVELYNHGLSNSRGIKKFYVGANEDISSSLYFEKVQTVIKKEHIIEKEIQVIRLSEFIKERGIRHIDILKLDVEGSECSIIEDITEVLDSVDFIVMEYHYAKPIINKNSLANILGELEKKGFTVIIKSTLTCQELKNKEELYYTFLIYCINRRYTYKEIKEALFFNE
jgi:FkbM family methyltransferase